ncbi:hypothetical protein [Cupriavidus metallidurans]|nr:hypothetical protein [Cupriavidus metallidurans]
MADKIVHVKLKGDDTEKVIQATDAVDDGIALVVKYTMPLAQ